MEIGLKDTFVLYKEKVGKANEWHIVDFRNDFQTRMNIFSLSYLCTCFELCFLTINDFLSYNKNTHTPIFQA